jgi:hypothetical protein
VVAAGVPLGVAAGALLGVASPLIGLGALGLMAVGLGASGALIVMLGKNATIRSFQLRNLLLWAGVTAGGVVSISLLGTGPLALPGIIVGWCFRSWVASSILGSAAVIAVRRAAGGDANVGAPSPEDAAGNRLLRAMKRVGHWLSRTFGRGANKLVSLRGDLDASVKRLSSQADPLPEEGSARITA